MANTLRIELLKPNEVDITIQNAHPLQSVAPINTLQQNMWCKGKEVGEYGRGKRLQKGRMGPLSTLV